jgi:hypothetical protein
MKQSCSCCLSVLRYHFVISRNDFTRRFRQQLFRFELRQRQWSDSGARAAYRRANSSHRRR